MTHQNLDFKVKYYFLYKKKWQKSILGTGTALAFIPKALQKSPIKTLSFIKEHIFTTCDHLNYLMQKTE